MNKFVFTCIEPHGDPAGTIPSSGNLQLLCKLKARGQTETNVLGQSHVAPSPFCSDLQLETHLCQGRTHLSFRGGLASCLCPSASGFAFLLGEDSPFCPSAKGRLAFLPEEDSPPCPSPSTRGGLTNCFLAQLRLNCA